MHEHKLSPWSISKHQFTTKLEGKYQIYFISKTNKWKTSKLTEIVQFTTVYNKLCHLMWDTQIKHEMRISNTGTFFSERETCIELHYRILHQHIYTEIKGRPFCRQYLNMHFLQRLLLCFLLNVIEIRALFSYWLHVCIAFRQVKNWTKTINCFTIQFQRVEKSKWFSTFTLPCLNAIMKSGLSQVCR